MAGTGKKTKHHKNPTTPARTERLDRVGTGAVVEELRVFSRGRLVCLPKTNGIKCHPKAANIKLQECIFIPEKRKHGHVSNLKKFKAAKQVVHFCKETTP